MYPSLSRFSLPADVLQALNEFEPLTKLIDVNDNMEGAIPVITPSLSDVKCVACVYAEPHQDLPYPKYSVLAPIKVRPNVYLYIEQEDGSIQRSPLQLNEMTIVNSHLKHWVNKPENYPENFNDLSLEEKTKYKRDNMIVFANIDFQEYPTQEDCLRKIRNVLCLPQVSPSPKNKKQKKNGNKY